MTYVLVGGSTLNSDVFAQEKNVHVAAITVSNEDLASVVPELDQAGVVEEGAQDGVAGVLGKVGSVVVAWQDVD